MNTVLCSVPTENPGSGLRLKRSENIDGIIPKIAITHINNWTENNGDKNLAGTIVESFTVEKEPFSEGLMTGKVEEETFFEDK